MACKAKRPLIRSRSYFDKETPAIALKSLFNKYDLDQNGMLDKYELYKLLQDDLGLDVEQCDIYHHLLDKDADGLISYDEFVTWLHSGERFQTITDKTRYYYLQNAIVMFKRYDIDKNQAIDEKEFQILLHELGGCEQNKGRELMLQIDVDKNGRISFYEFMKWLKWVPMEYLISQER